MRCNSLIHQLFYALSGALFCLVTQAEALLLDANFQQGYVVMSPQKDIYTRRVETEAVHLFQLRDVETFSTPDWRLVQWGTRESIAGTSPVLTDKSSQRWEKSIKNREVTLPYKAITLNAAGELGLELNAMADFEGRYLKSLDEYWPHLLMAQNIKSKKLNHYKTIELSLDARLLFDDKNISEGYQSGIHAARFPIAIAVRNTLTGNMFWLSLVIYDDRYPQSGFICKKCTSNKNGKENCQIPDDIDTPGRWECPFDGNRWSKEAEKQGTQKMLFRLPTKFYTKDNIHDGEWAHYQINLIPFIKAGIQAARDTRQLRGFSEDLRFYELTFFSMGWEITGLNHAAIAVKNLSLAGF